MPPIVFPKAVRFAVGGTIHDRPWVNIFDITLSEARPAAEADILLKAEQLMDSYFTSIAPLVVSTWNIAKCSWVDLDSLNGTTGVITDTPTNTFPKVGGSATQGASGNVALLAKKTVFGGRTIRNGRTFFCGIKESDTDGQNILSTPLGNWNTALSALAGVANGVAGGSTCVFGCISQAAGGAVGFNPVAGYQAEVRLATLRRRLRP